MEHLVQPMPMRPHPLSATANMKHPSPLNPDAKSKKKTTFFAPESRSSTPDIYLERSGMDQQWDDKRLGANGFDVQQVENEKGGKEEGAASIGIGLLPDEVYERTMAGWRFWVRQLVTKRLVWESDVIAAMQKRIRTPFLDAYFVNTSSLGTHTFFMTMLPAFCFFGHQDIARGLIFVLSLGVYASSFLKDLVCSPRPHAPPVTRLTIGNHHLEYGFPSTHSTNSVSIALFFFTIIHRLYTSPASTFTPPIGPSEPLVQNATTLIEETQLHAGITRTTYLISIVVLVFYLFSIVFGRLYTAMHSFTDCAAGVFLGVAIWGLWVIVGDTVDVWLRNSGWIVPAVVVPFCLYMVHRHPEPIDDCPCFEDAIAFMSVTMGEFITRWCLSRYGLDGHFFTKIMPGHPFGGSLSDMWSWWTIATAKLVVGILAIFAWRIFAKFLLHRILPPTFRFLAQLVTLPHRRYYTPATDYKNVVPDKGLHPIPSVLDLPGMLEIKEDGVSMSTARKQGSNFGSDLKLRGTRGKTEKLTGANGGEELGLGMEELGGKGIDDVKHYDADVLTKVFVYCGIGILASGVMPVVFELIGWAVRIY